MRQTDEAPAFATAPPRAPSRLKWFALGVVAAVAAQLLYRGAEYTLAYDALALASAGTPAGLSPDLGDPPAEIGMPIEPGKVFSFSLHLANTGRLPVQVVGVEEPEWWNLELVTATYAANTEEMNHDLSGDWPTLRAFALRPGESTMIGLRMRMHGCNGVPEGATVTVRSLPVRVKVGPWVRTAVVSIADGLTLRGPKGGVGGETVRDTPECERIWRERYGVGS